MTEITLRMGTRRSALALAQSRQVAAALEALHPGLRVEEVTFVTRGDREKGDLSLVGGKGLFTEELERGLLDGSLDFAVHSLKDLPVHLPDGLVVGAYPERADPRDVLVSEVAATLDELPAGAVLLTGSLRRRAQILDRRPDVVVEPIRGNVGTRLRKWRERGAAGVILAAAGLRRLGIDDVPAHPLDPEVVVPAPGQGTLALEVRAGAKAASYIRALNDGRSQRAAEAERHLVAAFGADCTLPLAAWATESASGGNGGGENGGGENGSGEMRLVGVLATTEGERIVRAETRGTEPAEVGERCVAAMRASGADRVLAEIRR